MSPHESTAKEVIMYDLIAGCVGSSLIVFFFCFMAVIDYFNEKAGNYDRMYERRVKAREQRRLDKERKSKPSI